MCPHTTICLLLYMCPHTAIYVCYCMRPPELTLATQVTNPAACLRAQACETAVAAVCCSCCA